MREQKPLPRGAFQQAVVYLVCAFSLVSLVVFVWQAIRNHNFGFGNDLNSYLNSARWFFDGHNPYTAEVRRYIYPEFLLLLAWPFTFLQGSYFEKALTAGLWSLSGLWAFTAVFVGSMRRLGARGRGAAILGDNLVSFCLLVLLLHPFLQDEFMNGQVNLFVIGGVAGYFFALHHNRPFLAALALATAASIKIWPGLALVWLWFDRKYVTALYFAILTALFTVVLPLAINSDALEYYRYFVHEVVPKITGSDFAGGFRSFSIISTVSYLFGITWHPLAKLGAIALLALALTWPVLRISREQAGNSDWIIRFVMFSALVSVIPLTFPMSESHHLLILIFPVTSALAYWRWVIRSGKGFWSDTLSGWFFVSLAVLHIGQGLKPTPLRLIGLVGIYFCLLALLRKVRVGRVDLKLR